MIIRIIEELTEEINTYLLTIYYEYKGSYDRALHLIFPCKIEFIANAADGSYTRVSKATWRSN